tara:strand:- start:6213 stop:7976 length:1764 start_codon:yes stop_codon:yes gene_type:complete
LLKTVNSLVNKDQRALTAFLVFLFGIVFLSTDLLYDPFHTPKNLVLIIAGCVIIPIIFILNFKFKSPLNDSFRLDFIGVLMLLRIIYLVASHPHPIKNIEITLLVLVSLFVIYKTGYVMRTNTIERVVNRLCYTLFMSGLILSIIGFFQFFQSLSVTDQAIKTTVIGTFGSPNAFGNWLGLSLLSGIFVAKNSQKKWVPLIGITIITVCLILSKSRGAVLAVLASLVVIYLVKRKRTILPYVSIGIFILIAGLLLSLIDINSTTGRLYIWQISLQMLKDNFLTGIGIGNFGNEFLDYQGRFLTENPDFPSSKAAFIRSPHNEFLQGFIEGGIIGGGIFIAITISHFVNLFSNLKNGKSEKDLILLGLSVILVVHALIDSIFHFTPQLVLFYFLVGLSNRKKIFQIKLKTYITIPFLIILMVFSSFVVYKNIMGRYYWKKGMRYSESAMFSLSIPYFEKSLKYIEYGELYFHYGAALVHNNNSRRGLYFLDKATETFLDKNIPLTESVAYNQAGKFKKAIEKADRVLFYYPDLLAPHLLKAESYYRLGEFDNSKIELLKCINEETGIKSPDTKQIAKEASALWIEYGY